jgi:hypothetical protein
MCISGQSFQLAARPCQCNFRRLCNERPFTPCLGASGSPSEALPPLTRIFWIFNTEHFLWYPICVIGPLFLGLVRRPQTAVGICGGVVDNPSLLVNERLQLFLFLLQEPFHKGAEPKHSSVLLQLKRKERPVISGMYCFLLDGCWWSFAIFVAPAVSSSSCLKIQATIP